ncbi:ABC transporter permease family protein [Enterococcus casseliflavus]|uniref:hypothetical protein n=1 Tax=Enterococcus casseliflavus TaxID=37734 RepID=UPI001E520ABC|nr:hypothetical protein [Enterococcus casseliflavus]MCD5160428.1 hypothetical protein [Enterococcus casseliflavus]
MKFSNYLSEIFESVKRKKHLLFFYSLFLLFSFLTLSVSNIMSQENSNEEKRISTGDTKTFKLVDNLIGEDEENFLKNLQSVNYLSSMYNELLGSTIGEYQVIGSQGINYLEENNLDTQFIDNYEHIVNVIDNMSSDEIPYKSLQINNKVLQRFKLRLSQGNLFSQEDYQYNDNKISVILGDNYSEYFSVGDKIQISYLFKNFEAKVIGFVEKGERIVFNEYDDYVLDDRIILPFIEKAPQQLNKEDFSFFQKHFLNGINGYYQVPDSLSQEQMYKFVNELSQPYQVGTIDLIGESGFHLSSILYTIIKNNRLLKLVAYFSIVVLIAVTIVFSYLEMFRDKKVYHLHLFLGATKKEIRQYFLGEKILLLSSVVIISVIITNYLGVVTSSFLISLLCLALLLFLLFYLSVTIILKKWRITND